MKIIENPMPQFDISFFPTQLFWLFICFIITFLALWKKGIPQITEIFQARSDKIEGQLREEEELREQGKKIAHQIENRLTKAHADGSDLIQATMHEANKNLTLGRNDIVTELRLKIKDAEKEIVHQKAKAYPQVRTIAADTAKSMIEALTSIKLGSKQVVSVLDEITLSSKREN